MPAADVEIIRYTLGDQVGALTTLRGELYGLEEAAKLGYFHEVVEPDQLLTFVQALRAMLDNPNFYDEWD